MQPLDSTSQAAATSTDPRPVYRVFRYEETGVHLVLRDRAEILGAQCVLGPTHEDGSAVSFAEATAFANHAFLERVQSLVSDTTPAIPLVELDALAKRLRELYAARAKA